MSYYSKGIYGRRRPRREFPFAAVLIGLAFFGAIVVPVAHILMWESTHTTVTITVDEKDRVAKSDGGSESRIYTDQGVYGVGDDWIQGEFASADTYNQLDVGGTYEVDTVGYRLPLLSLFPNIIEVRDAD